MCVIRTVIIVCSGYRPPLKTTKNKRTLIIVRTITMYYPTQKTLLVYWTPIASEKTSPCLYTDTTKKKSVLCGKFTVLGMLDSSTTRS